MTKDGRITSQTVARILGVTQRTVNRYHDDGTITPVDRVPGNKGARLYDERAIRKLAAERLTEQEARTAAARRHLEQVA